MPPENTWRQMSLCALGELRRQPLIVPELYVGRALHKVARLGGSGLVSATSFNGGYRPASSRNATA
jgi:hypothetical protein